jgi:hypothetical protein
VAGPTGPPGPGGSGDFSLDYEVLAGVTRPVLPVIDLFGDISTRRMVSQNPQVGVPYNFQPSFFNMRVSLWSALGNSTSVSTFNWDPDNTGNVTIRNVQTTNAFTMQRRLGFRTSNSASASAGTSFEDLQFCLGSASTLIGGFFYYARFGVATANATQRVFVGMNSDLSFENVNPSSLTNIVGFGYDSSDSQWQFMHNDGSGTATKIPMPSAWPIRSVSTDMYEIQIFCSNENSTVHYYMRWLNGPANAYVANASVSGSNLPSSTTLLSPFIQINNGGTGTPSQIDVCMQYIDTSR